MYIIQSFTKNTRREYSEKMHHPREENVAMPRLFGFRFLKKVHIVKLSRIYIEIHVDQIVFCPIQNRVSARSALLSRCRVSRGVPVPKKIKKSEFDTQGC